MGWSLWGSCPSGHGKISTKTESKGGRTSEHTLRTASKTYSGNKSNHAHVVVHTNSNGRKTAHGAGFKNKR